MIILDSNSSVATDELVTVDKKIDVFHTITINDSLKFPVEDFFKVPFTHHSVILSGVKDIDDRYYYINRTAQEHLAVKKVAQLIKQQAHKHQGTMPNNFTHTIDDSAETRRAVEMFKDEYLLDFINSCFASRNPTFREAG